MANSLNFGSSSRVRDHERSGRLAALNANELQSRAIGRPTEESAVLLEAQFQQADFEGEGFLDVGVKPALELFEDAEIFERVFWGNSLGDFFCRSHLREVQKLPH